jgi:phage baseplate assembly protein gpV
MQTFINAMKAHVGAMLSQIAQPRIGVVTAVDPARHMVKVALQPEGVQSGWVPVTVGWSMLELPATGQQVLTVPQEGDADSLHVIGRVFAPAGGDAPYKAPSAILSPLNTTGNAQTNIVPGQEVLLRNVSGAVIRLLPDGSIYLHGNVALDGNLSVNGNLSVAGNMTFVGDTADSHGSLNRLRGNYNAHVHSDPQGSSVAITSQQDPL